ncbi:HEAT repeat domain-containing protein [Hyalangium rubrum]|uniref:HEAT repeat domain-containing protein n=1 Tax=Hyalangium rubrum TaxID=3103134 RepID=A0ABU5HAK6_9BACT|nr:HEAT repeat domain-containing protein [Hyalangium sp. s54d21]MDY7230507.1 HEAT repeat domain-containing protein [Hyalangium sp. s54d21]
MSPALLLLVLLSASPRGGTGATDCWVSCQRHVQDASLRARVCKACITRGGPESWVLAVGGLKPVPEDVLRSALKDEDWRVRWASVRAGAKARGVPENRALAEWVTAGQAAADLPACLTAARAAAEAGKSPQDFFQGAGDKGPAAVSRIQARRDVIRQALEVEVYAEDPGTRERALSHLSTFLNQPPARVALQSMEGRPESGDAAVAGGLRAIAERKDTSVGRMLLEVAKPADQERVNRLFAVYSQELQALQPELTSGDPQKRRTAVASLRIYGPLAQRELEVALKDPDRQVRQHAARALAQAEGLKVQEAVGQRLRSGADVDAQRPWLELLAREKNCQATLLAVAEDSKQPAPVRGEALAQLVDCDMGGRDRLKRIAPFLRDAQAPIRAGAVRALGAVAAGAEMTEALTAALEDPAPEVVAAAIDTAALKRQSPQADVIAALLGSEHPQVRQAAALALERLGKPQHVKALSECLRQDSVPAVRVSAAQTLGVLGGPFAVSALSEAAKKDPDTHVQHVSREALKRLGFSGR